MAQRLVVVSRGLNWRLALISTSIKADRDFVLNRAAVIPGQGDIRQVWQAFLEQTEAGRDLRGGHFPPSLRVLNKRVEDIALLNFNPVGFRHPETGLPASFSHWSSGF